MRKGFILIILTLSLLAVLAGGACVQPDSGEMSAGDFYQDNMATIIVNGGVGGGTDYSGRLFASYWGETTGGPPMEVRVMSGGGGIEGLNYVYNSKPDGLTIGITHHPADITSPILLGGPGPEFDPLELSWIGMLGFSVEVFVLPLDSPIKSIEDLKNAGKLVFGQSTPGGAGSISSAALIEIFELDAKIVHGYESPELGLALRRGEIDCYSIVGNIALDDMERGFVKPFLVFTAERSDWFPDTPVVTEVIDLTPKQEDYIVFIEALGAVKSYFGPPGIPLDRLTYLRRTFDQIVSNEAFIKQAKLRFPVWQTPLPGEGVEADINRVLSMSPDTIESVRSLFEKYIK
ncbi:Bug family tripartite tricarboxylate transporter substrate binding protein [Chloroflexota bacterium]